MVQKILIAAIDKNGGIGKDGYMPWHYPADLKRRQNIVVTSKAADYRSRFADKYPASELSFTSDLNCKDLELPIDAKVFYCGGANLYQQVFNLVNLDIIYLSRLDESYDCDTFFPRNPESLDRGFEPYLPPHFINSFSDTMAGKNPFTFQIYTPKPLIIY
jgi:dihydrofolate reductase